MLCFQNGRLTKQLKLFTIVHPPSGPTLTPVRFVNCNLTVDDVFPNIKYKYNGKQLVVVRTEVSIFQIDILNITLVGKRYFVFLYRTEQNRTLL